MCFIAIIDISTSQGEVETELQRYETAPTNADQINSPFCQGSDLTITTKTFPCFPHKDNSVGQQVAYKLQVLLAKVAKQCCLLSCKKSCGHAKVI